MFLTIVLLSAFLGTVTTSRVPSPFPDVMEGHWASRAIHYHADGTELVETGDVRCQWVLERTYLQCERTHTAGPGSRRTGIQFWARDPASGRIEVLTLSAGRFLRVLQRSTTIADDSFDMTGEIPTRDNRWISIRSSWTTRSPETVVYRNETEEQTGVWRVDYQETYTRVR
jgi:hypothetical protein